MMLLNSAATAIRRFRIVWTVTNLQQGVAAGSALLVAGQRRTAKRDPNRRLSPLAELLGKGWRFFAPYAATETSPLLRQFSSSHP
jgi:hypothetical protein